ncbi:unnamed protein product [Adineta ricciae]|uniref:Uncharacterized protein n=1 Tax=Adineta ricciae TaxID=249248 RepID=A0A814LU89_ADIRI|nr:unnamed protein product [Adineta ricciae]CAF1070393.1 unnamed protein product [Adineta ricciae]
MGLTISKEQLMADAIENQDIDNLKAQIQSITDENMKVICKSLVPGNANRCTLLHYATWQDNSELLEMFLKFVDDLEIRDGLGWTPLMTAVQRDSKENVKLLLKYGAKIDCDNMQGMDLIANAMHYNDIELIQILMDHGAQVKSSSGAQNGCYLLHFAVDEGLINVAKLLIEEGKILVDTLDKLGWSALHIAAGHNFVDFVRLLEKYGADINIKDLNGNTPLAWAKHMNAKEVIEELERLGARADEEWHGEELAFKDSQIKFEEEKERGIDNNQFEMDELGDSTLSDNKGLILLDALQRQ